MKSLVKVSCFLGVLAALMMCVPHALQAAALTADQNSELTAALAGGQSYTATVKQAVGTGMDCEEVVLFLCKHADNNANLVKEIVSAAITNGCDAEIVVDAALKAGAPLQAVVTAAKLAGATDAQVTAAAGRNNIDPNDVANALANALAGTLPGGRIGGDSGENSTGGTGGGGNGSGGGGGGGGGGTGGGGQDDASRYIR